MTTETMLRTRRCEVCRGFWSFRVPVTRWTSEGARPNLSDDEPYACPKCRDTQAVKPPVRRGPLLRSLRLRWMGREWLNAREVAERWNIAVTSGRTGVYGIGWHSPGAAATWCGQNGRYLETRLIAGRRQWRVREPERWASSERTP
jgi:hypothetical protein